MTTTSTDAIPEYSAKWWSHKITQAEKELDEKWRTSADKIVDIYLAEDSNLQEENDKYDRRYNVFWANTQIIMSALYATPPKPRVTRQYGDAKDDIGRTAALILERILNFGMTRDQSDMHDAFTQATEDRLIPGLGQVWLRYEVEVQDVPTDEVTGAPAYQKIVYENVATDYVHWRDFVWSPARTWNEVWWVARRVWLTKKAVKKRFGHDKLKLLQDAVKEAESERPYLPKYFKDGKYEIIECWCKESNKAYWLNRSMDELLDEKDDPLKLEDFFPCPQPLLATHTSKTVVPRPEYAMSQDQYEELNVLNSRIYILTEALRVVGVYDKTQDELKQLFKSPENRMIAVENWAMLAEKGGLKGVVDWFPVDVVAKVLELLMSQRSAAIQQIYELTSISDIMRGASNPRETLGAQKLKSQYSSVRLQLMQQAVGRFIRHAMRLKTEIVCKHMQPQTIAEISQIMFTESAKFAQPAIQLLKGDYRATQYRIEVSEETLSIADYNAERELRTEYLTAVGQFLSQSASLIQVYPNAMPYLLQMIQWLTSSFRGSADIESVLDDAVNMATNQPPKSQEEQKPAGKSPEELQLEMQKEQIKAQTAMQTKQIDAQVTLTKTDKDNSTKVLIEEMKQGVAEDKLAMEAIGMTLDDDQLKAQQAHQSSESAAQRDHDATQSDADRKAAAAKPKAGE